VYEPHDEEGEAPDAPHLVLMMAPGEGLAVPPGANLAIVMNAKTGVDKDSPEHGGVVPLVLLSVSKTKLRFACACGQKSCTREVSFKATWKGIHPKQFKQG
jgi:hypothetical protein